MRSIELLDYYEARTNRGAAIDLGTDELDFYGATRVALDRLARVSPLRSANYELQLADFENAAQFISGPLAVEGHSESPVVLPDDCRREPVAAFGPQENAFQAAPPDRILVDVALWKLLPPSEQAGVILHLLLLREAVGYGGRESAKLREFNALLAESRFVRIRPREFLKALLAIPFPVSDFAGVPIRFARCKSAPGGNAEACIDAASIEAVAALTFSADGHLLSLETDDLRTGQPIGLGFAIGNHRMRAEDAAENPLMSGVRYDFQPGRVPLRLEVLDARRANWMSRLRVIDSPLGRGHGIRYLRFDSAGNIVELSLVNRAVPGEVMDDAMFHTASGLSLMNTNAWFNADGRMLRAATTVRGGVGPLAFSEGAVFFAQGTVDCGADGRPIPRNDQLITLFVRKAGAESPSRFVTRYGWVAYDYDDERISAVEAMGRTELPEAAANRVWLGPNGLRTLVGSRTFVRFHPDGAVSDAEIDDPGTPLTAEDGRKLPAKGCYAFTEEGLAKGPGNCKD